MKLRLNVINVTCLLELMAGKGHQFKYHETNKKKIHTSGDSGPLVIYLTINVCWKGGPCGQKGKARTRGIERG